MKLVYRHENRILVSNAKNILENAGIMTVLQNEFASSAVGELSFLDAWPQLWVLDDADYENARKIIAGLEEPQTGKDWHCTVCNEINAPSFEICWNCQTERSTT